MRTITPELLEEITSRLVAALEPEEIVLFGSYAWGTPNSDSDLDLFIIVPDGVFNYNRIEWGVRARRCLDDLMLDVDFLITTRSAAEEYKNVPGSLKRKILEKGKVLYESSKTQAVASMDYQS